MTHEPEECSTCGIGAAWGWGVAEAGGHVEPGILHGALWGIVSV
jgi:hypothetical protein